MRYFIVLLILLLASPAFATVQFFPADSPTLGANALDTILGDGSAGVYEALANGDAAVVITTGLDMCVYLLDFDIDCAATTTETPCPQYVKPETPGDCTECCWILTDLNGVGYTSIPDSTPTMAYKDKEATAGDVNCRSYVNCTDVVDTTEDCDWTLECQVNGTPTNKIVADADGRVTVTNLSATSAILVTPALGTPSACTLTSCTGLPIAGISGATLVIAELNQLATMDATTISAAQWALLGALAATLTAAEVNILDGVTGVTAAELSYIGDVTSLIQAQLDLKAPLASPTFTGTPNIGAATGTSLTLTGNIAGLIPPVVSAVGDAAMDAADCAGQAYYNTGANTYILPAAAAGLNCCFRADSAHAVTVRPLAAGNDHIWYLAEDCGEDDDIVSPATLGSFICLHAQNTIDWMAWGSANTWVCE